jgi:hypothetical protein
MMLDGAASPGHLRCPVILTVSLDLIGLTLVESTPDDEEALRKDGSYPSGHSSIGWGWALILTELAPDRAEEILARGRAFGGSRNVCNAHYRRYTDILADACARIGADVVRYTFIAVDLHHLLLAGLPAHPFENVSASRFQAPLARLIGSQAAHRSSQPVPVSLLMCRGLGFRQPKRPLEAVFVPFRGKKALLRPSLLPAALQSRGCS